MCIRDRYCGVLTVAAQDLIIKADASKVEAKVTEITPESVRYKRFSNPDGPTYVLPVSEISYIQYANGEKEMCIRDSRGRYRSCRPRDRRPNNR